MVLYLIKRRYFELIQTKVPLQTYRWHLEHTLFVRVGIFCMEGLI